MDATAARWRQAKRAARRGLPWAAAVAALGLAVRWRIVLWALLVKFAVAMPTGARTSRRLGAFLAAHTPHVDGLSGGAELLIVVALVLAMLWPGRTDERLQRAGVMGLVVVGLLLLWPVVAGLR